MNPPGTILLVEDDKNDVFFLKYAFKGAGIECAVEVAQDGHQAMDYLAGVGQYADRALFPMPVLVLLDLKLPVRSGLEVLTWIREQPSLNDVNVVMLSSSTDNQDIDAAKRLGAQDYLVKPLSLDRRLEMAKQIKEKWLDPKRTAGEPRTPTKSRIPNNRPV